MSGFTITSVPGDEPRPTRSAEQLLELARSRPQGYQPSPEEAAQMANDLAAIEFRRAAALPVPGTASPVPVDGMGSGYTITSMPDERAIDKKAGAPASVRNAVGGAPEADRLATLQRYYPDAKPYDDGKSSIFKTPNFVFTDPKTGRPTLYNPPGMDVGDLASATPEIAEAAGGFLGAAAATPPALAAAPFTGGASLLTIPASMGLGAAAGKLVEDTGAKLFTRRVDTRSLPRVAGDTAVTAGTNAVAPRMAQVALGALARGAGAVTRYGVDRLGNAAQGLRDFVRTRVSPSAGAVTGNEGLQLFEKGISNTPGGAVVAKDLARRQIAQLQEAVDNLAADYARGNGLNPPGRVLSPQEAGERLQQAARNAGDRFRVRRNMLDDEVERRIGAQRPVDVPNVRALRDQVARELAEAPATGQRRLGQLLGELDDLLQDAAQGIPFGALRRVRTDIGELINKPDITGRRPPPGQLARMYGALVADIRAAADAAGPQARRALNTHDRYVRFNRSEGVGGAESRLARLQKLEDAGSGEEAYKYAMAQSKDGGSRLFALRRSMPREDWDTLAASVLSRLGRAKPNAEGFVALGEDTGRFSVASFLTNYSTLKPEAKRALFMGTRYAQLVPELDRVARVVARIKDADSFANWSGTARAMGVLGILQGVTEGAVGGDGSIIAGTVGFAVVAPAAAMKLLTNPRFVAWLADAGGRQMTNPARFSAHLGQIANIAIAEPEIREEVQQFVDAMRAVPPAPAKAAPRQ
jgi:hypothetical protein